MLRRDFFARHRDYLLFGLYFGFCLVSLAISSNAVDFRPKDFGLSVFSFFQHGLAGAVSFVGDTVNSVRELTDLRREHEAALERLKYYERVEKDYHALELENRALRELLSFSQALRYDNIPAKIIGRDPDNYGFAIIVNKGTGSGVSKNLPVVAIQGGQQGLVGRTVSVGLNSAIIVPVYDANSYIAARLLRSRHEGLLEGRGGGSKTLLMRYVRKTAKEDIRHGDMIMTSGMNSIYPIGIHIGTVAAILSRDYESSLELEVDPVVDFSRLEYVFIIKPES